MKKFWAVPLAVGIMAAGLSAPAAADEISDLKNMLKQQSEIIQQLQKRLDQVEQRQAPAAPEHTAREHEGAKEKAGATLTDRLAAVEEKVKGMPGLPAGIKISGLLDTSYTYNINSPGRYYVNGAGPNNSNRRNGYRVFDTEADSFNVDLFELVVEKPVADKGDAGFRVDLDFGKTAGILKSGTIGPEERNWAGAGSNQTDFEVQQAYVTYRLPVGNGLDISLGKFVTLLGAEVIEAPSNYNISRSYLFGYAIPFTHTGVRLQYPINDKLSATLGINNGWDNVNDNNHGKSVEGQLAFNFSEKYQLYVNGIYGSEQDDRDGPKRGVIDLVGILKPIDKLTLQLNFDYGSEKGAYTFGGVTKRAEWEGFSMVANYDFTDKFSLSGRWEYFDDQDGYRLDGGKPAGAPSLLDKGALVKEYTLTGHYHFTPNMAVRAEYRHDDADKEIFVDKQDLSDTQDTVALEFYYRF